MRSVELEDMESVVGIDGWDCGGGDDDASATRPIACSRASLAEDIKMIS